jgi:hypothetical protein
MKTGNMAILAAVAVGGYLLYKKSGGQLGGLDDLLSGLWDDITGGGGGKVMTPPIIVNPTNAIGAGTVSGNIDKNAMPPSSDPVIVAQVNTLKQNAIQLAVNAANFNVAMSVNHPTQNWTQSMADAAIANAQAANAGYWASKGFS